MRSAVVLILLVLLATTGVRQAHAWGKSGHSIIGDIAEARLDPKARAAVSELLTGETDPTLAGVSIWADVMRERVPEYLWTFPLHFVSFKPGTCNYQAASQCRDDLCVVGAIERYSRQLTDTWLPRETRRDALKFIVHFVGDVHQPLHAGYAADRGGNDYVVIIDGVNLAWPAYWLLPKVDFDAPSFVDRDGSRFRVRYPYEGRNLHSVWDTLIIDSLKLEWPAYRARLDAVPLNPQSQSLAALDRAADWAEESCRITQGGDIYPPTHRVDVRYLETERPRVNERLKLAGERLAMLLNRLLGEG